MTRRTKETTEAPGTRSAAGEVQIDATPERVWRALTDARELERWFPLEAKVEPGAGGSLWMSWGNEFSETMQIEEWDPPRHLRTSWPWSGGAVVTDYLLSPVAGGTRLRVVTSGFSDDPTWDAWVESTTRGWAFELRVLKHYLECREGQDRRSLFLRRRVPLSGERAWQRLVGAEALAAHWLRGEWIDEAPPVQLAAILDDPDGAIVRISIDPVHRDVAAGDPGASHDATLWISLWGESGVLLDDIDREWTEILERTFPDGTTLRATR